MTPTAMSQRASSDHEAGFETPGAALKGIAFAILLSLPLWLGIAVCCGLL